MFSQTTEYALRAMVYLASEPTGASATKEIAAKAKIPSAYLAKVFQYLRRAGLVHAQRGVGGGIKLAKPLGKISLLEIVEAVDPLRRPTSKTVATLATLEKTMIAATAMLREQLAVTTLADVASTKKGTRRSAKK